jgi:C4-dicarboxylate-specific signal transduction histidine kinase
MRAILESLGRLARPQSDRLAAVSVTELLSDMGELHRPEFLERAIEFRLSIAPDLPRVLCRAEQLRQAVRNSLQFAMRSVDSPGLAVGLPRVVRLEAASRGRCVQILVAHSGPGFANPEHAFDSPLPAQENAAAGGNLSLCAAILRDNNGRVSAMNLEPRGAAIVLELEAA